MSRVAPLGPVYQAGTLSGNPLAMAAGIATLGLLNADAYDELERLGARLERGLTDAARRARVTVRVQRVASLLTLFFTDREVQNEDDAKTSDRERFALFHAAMLRRGVLLPPSQFECLFLSLAHDDGALDQVVEAADGAFREVA
jgi:glutamate-1-semialdehyde 2,1-aminomutase